MLPPARRADAKLTNLNHLCVAVTGVKKAYFSNKPKKQQTQNMYLTLEMINLDAKAVFSLCIGSFYYIQV